MCLLNSVCNAVGFFSVLHPASKVSGEASASGDEVLVLAPVLLGDT